MKTFKVLLVCDEKHRSKVSFSEFDHENLLEVQFIASSMKGIAKQLSITDLVVTCGDWHHCLECNKTIELARLIDIEVIHQTRYKDYVKQKYN